MKQSCGRDKYIFIENLRLPVKKTFDISLIKKKCEITER